MNDTEKTINWLFLISAIYLAPHTDKWLGLILGSIFCALATVLWALKIFVEWKNKA
jgi:hypothetical protein